MKLTITLLISVFFFVPLFAQKKDIFILDFHNDKKYNSILGKNVANEFERSLNLCTSKYRVVPRLKYQRQLEENNFEAMRSFLQEEGLDYILYGNIYKDDITNKYTIEFIFEEIATNSIILIENVSFKQISQLLNSSIRYETIAAKIAADDELCRRISKQDKLTVIDEDVTAKTNEEKAEDSDKDGVPDAIDKEPNTPIGATVDERGVEIINGSDKWTSIERQAILKMLPDLPNIPFEFGKADIGTDAYMKLDQMARLMKMYPIIVVNLEGNAPNDEKLAKQRAEVVRTYLLENYQFPERRFITSSKFGILSQDEVVSSIALDKMDF